jgi:hypothetical protein
VITVILVLSVHVAGHVTGGIRWMCRRSARSSEQWVGQRTSQS